MRDRLKHLGTGVAIYGAGDALVQIVNFFLLAVYVRGGFLTSVDYGALAILVALEAFCRVLSRLGLDGAFMRYFHERGDDLPRLASTIAWTILIGGGSFFGVLWIVAPAIGGQLFEDPAYTSALRLMNSMVCVRSPLESFMPTRLGTECASSSTSSWLIA